MYVTRRLLRSTMTSEPVAMKPNKEEKKATKKKEGPSVSTLKRRAAVRASAKIEMTANISSAATRKNVTKNSLKKRNDEDQPKDQQQKQKKKRQKANEQEKKEKRNVVPAIALYGYQLLVDVHDRGEQYAEARILDLDPEEKLLFVHYMGWNARFDAWVSLKRVKAHGSRCCGAEKKVTSWDGKISLFAKKDEVVALQQNGNPKTTKTKERGTLSPKEGKTTRKAHQSVSRKPKKGKQGNEQTELKTVRKNSKKLKKETKKATMNLQLSKKKQQTASTCSRPTTERVQVAVGTMDEKSECKSESEGADLVLDVEVEGREISNDQSEGESESDQEEEEDQTSPRRIKGSATIKRNRQSENDTASLSGFKRNWTTSQGDMEIDTYPPKKKKAKPEGADTTLKTAMETAPLVSSRRTCVGVGSATREKLAAIFRLRVQQKQQMERMNLGQSSFQQTLQDDLTGVTTLSETASDTAGTEDLDDNDHCVNRIANAAAEEYQRQLQHFYQQQLVLANGLSMNVPSGKDPSSIPLQGGMMDPRIIQERLTAMEERRRHQAHVQAYYHHLMVTRERNVRALAANQAFMTSSAAVWEKQLRETQSEDGTSSITSWKDMMATDSSETDKTSPILKPATNAPPPRSHADKDDPDSVQGSENSRATTAPEHTIASTASSDAVETTTASPPTSLASVAAGKCGPAAAPAEHILYEFVL